MSTFTALFLSVNRPASERTALMNDSLTTPSYRRVNTQPLYQSVVEQLVKRIVAGALKPDETLPVEAKLAEQFGVSRTVIREAVRVLVSKRLLTVRQGSGMRVAPPEHWDYLDPLVLFEQVRSGRGEALLEEVLEVRRILEVEVAALSALRRTGDDLGLLRAKLAGMKEAIKDPETFTELDIKFHDIILASARNRLLREALQPVAQTIRSGRFITMTIPGAVEKSLRGHEAICAAIERQDAQAAKIAMLDHVRQFEHDIRTGLQAEGKRS